MPFQTVIRSVFDQTYELLGERLKALGEQGRQRLPSEPELASQLGVSRGIVRRVLAQLARERLVDRQPGRGTFIRPERKARTLCALVSGEPTELFNPARTTLLHGASLEIASVRGVEILFRQVPHREGPGLAERMIRDARSLRADGYLLALSLGLEECRKVLAANIPLVTTYDDFDQQDVPAVFEDHCKGGTLLGEYLAERGCRRIALVTRHLEGDRLRLGERLLDGMRQVLGDITPRPGRAVVGTDYNEDECRAKVGDLLDAAERYDAIVVTSDHRVIGALAAFRERGLDGSGGPLLVPYLETPAIAPGTCIALPPLEELGREAARMLCRLMRGEALEETVKYLAPRLVVR